MKIQKIVLGLIGLLGFATLALAGACSETAKCPLDDETAVLVNEEASTTGAVVGTYEHQLPGGGKHRFQVRCQ